MMHLRPTTLLLSLCLLAAGTTQAKTDALDALRQRLPAYSPEEHERLVSEDEARRANDEAARADPDLVLLPEMTVMEHTLFRMEEDSLLQKGAFDEELIKRELSAFDRYFLNRYTIPFIGVSKAVRAREAYLARKNEELQNRMARLAGLVARLDPAEAREFREVLRDTDLANGNTAKETARASSARGGSGGSNSQ